MTHHRLTTLPPAPLPPPLAPKYAEMEMRHRFINHARNVWDRAVTLLPRVDILWYKVGLPTCLPACIPSTEAEGRLGRKEELY